MRTDSHDAVVVGAGPNGLAAAIRLAQEGLSVVVLEAAGHVGGGMHSAELTLPGFVHDVCSAIHPLGRASRFLRRLPLDAHGLAWVEPGLPVAHPLDDGSAVLVHRSPGDTGAELGADGRAYRRLMAPFVSQWERVLDEILQPLIHAPRHPLLLAKFGRHGLRSATSLARGAFAGERARAMFAGLAAHSLLPLGQAGTAAFGLVLGLLAHAVGWPFPRGGAQQLANAMAGHLRSLGGEIITGMRVESLNQMPSARTRLFDVTPRQLLLIAGDALPERYQRRLSRFQYGAGVFKVDYALNAPIPWQARDCRRAGTVHVGGTLSEIASSERQVSHGEHPERPFVLVAQPSLFDDTRAPREMHTAWAYCHVPNGSTFDMTDRIERQVERFAPGFRDCIVARHTTDCSALERMNANMVGGDINGGAAGLSQQFARPVLSWNSYRTPLHGVYLCSASTPPGGGVHGMCGFHAAETALRDFSSRAGGVQAD